MTPKVRPKPLPVFSLSLSLFLFSLSVSPSSLVPLVSIDWCRISHFSIPHNARGTFKDLNARQRNTNASIFWWHRDSDKSVYAPDPCALSHPGNSFFLRQGASLFAYGGRERERIPNWPCITHARTHRQRSLFWSDAEKIMAVCKIDFFDVRWNISS